MQSTPEIAAVLKDRLAILRSERSESLRDIARESGVTLSVLHSAISGNSTPSASALVLLSRHYGVSVDWLLGETDVRAKRRSKQPA